MEMNKGFGKFMGMADGCCYCLPMHITKFKQENAAQFEKAKEDHQKFYGK
jgi:hypothetical protein